MSSSLDAIDSDDSDEDENFFAPPAFPKKKKVAPKINAEAAKKMMEKIASGLPISDTKKRKQRKISNNGGRDLKSKQKRRRITIGACTSSGSGITSETDGANKNTSTISKTETTNDTNDRRKDPNWISLQAMRTVDELKLDVADKITSLENVGWIKATKNKKFYYPAVLHRSDDSFVRILLKDKNKSKSGHVGGTQQLKAQIIGFGYRYSLQYENIPYSRWIPYTKGDADDSDDNEKKLTKFLKSISRQSNFQGDLLALKIEEYAIKKIWSKVRNQQDRYEQEKKKQQEEDEKKKAPVHVPAVVSQEYPCCHDQSSSSSDDDDDGDDGIDPPSPGRRRKGKKTTRLCVNDEIEFYSLMATNGDPSELRRARIVGIRPKGRRNRLLLSNNTMPLPESHPVRLLPDGTWKPIECYRLRKAGIQNIAEAGLKNNVSTFKRVQKDIIQAADDYWKKQQEEQQQSK